ncbi:DUF59 domain-containing protein [Halovenus sp. WSH3]|uniref:DUF59 domain-containing protein n=1 Tax=Halovenus carboxidivorans TaxID=2692199 RepID=A0A6B0TBL8_9EURY|nr:iron-sulfur cluster assembly protein [Halovenus carboxidivorans]MXR52300.1 DUF59 domain-containing protein [Halovenus carboxidivorans]
MSGRSTDDPAATAAATRREPTEAAVRDRLDRVTDPELDESIVALEYIDEIAIEGETVTVDFTLPTAWCSPAFAWMMATDARDEIETLESVDTATIRLHEHMHETEITEGVNQRQSFAETFPDADGGVAEIRATLDQKARLARQYEAINALTDAGLDPEQIVDLTEPDIELSDESAIVYVRNSAVAVAVSREPIAEYLQKARTVGLYREEEPVFRDPEGEPIDPERFAVVQKRARLASVNMSGQGNICDALNEARRAEDRPPLSELDH